MRGITLEKLKNFNLAQLSASLGLASSTSLCISEVTVLDL